MLKPKGNRLRRRRKARSSIIVFGFAAILYACLIYYFSSQSVIPTFAAPVVYLSDKLVHFIEFALFGSLLFLTFASAGWRPWDAPLAIILGGIYATMDEVHQFFVPGRVADPMDALANWAGVFVAVLILACIDRRIYPS
jgi:VanZ family protein